MESFGPHEIIEDLIIEFAGAKITPGVFRSYLRGYGVSVHMGAETVSPAFPRLMQCLYSCSFTEESVWGFFLRKIQEELLQCITRLTKHMFLQLK